MPYKPEYKKGQILVRFKLKIKGGFEETFGEGLGYKLSNEDYDQGDNVVIYKTKKGEEEKAMKKFESYPEFVDWTSLRDVKNEKRWNDLEEAINMLQNLNDDVEISDKKYNKKLDQISNYLKKIKTK